MSSRTIFLRIISESRAIIIRGCDPYIGSTHNKVHESDDEYEDKIMSKNHEFALMLALMFDYKDVTIMNMHHHDGGASMGR